MVGLVLETPFTSIRDMLLALYPEKWLPYRYLGGLVWGEWDSRGAVATIAEKWGGNHGEVERTEGNKKMEEGKPKVLILEAERDELVPRGQADELVEGFRLGGMEAEKVVVRGALHNDVMERGQARKAVVEFLDSLH